MILEKVKAELAKEEKSLLHDALLNHCLQLLEPSRRDMEEYYKDWDFFEDVYKGRVKLTDSDKKARTRGEISSTIDPLTQSQVDTG